MYKALSAPLVVQIEVTERCPNSCVHCYNFWRHGEQLSSGLASLSLDDVDRIMDEVERSKVFALVITGGEPFLNAPAIFKILDRAETNDILGVTINSSLLGLTDDHALQLTKYRRFRSILTSITGPSSELHDRIVGHPGAFNHTTKGMEVLRKHQIPVSVNMVVSRVNQGHVRETAALCQSLGVSIFNATRATAPSNCADFTEYSLGLDEFHGYLTELGEAGREYDIPVGALTVYPLCGVKSVREHPMTSGRRCMAGVTVAVISASGEVRACTHISQSFGNIFNESLETLWGRMAQWRDGSLIPRNCRSCAALAICGGGCRADALVVNGSLNADDPLMSLSDVEFAIAEYVASMKSPNYVELPKRLMLNPEVRMRREPFGSSYFLGNQSVGMFNQDATSFLSDDILRTGRRLEEVEELVPLEFLEELVRKGILVSASNNVEYA
jgi:radical SAM protein with 4Fe4S-binding SPASM domain